jgi:ankyrin repeat protein
MRKSYHCNRGFCIMSKRDLHTCAFLGDVNEIKQLLDSGAYVDTLSNAGWTPVLIAAASGEIDIVELLYRYGGNIHEIHKDTGRTALHWALLKPTNGTSRYDEHKHFRLIRFLVEKGVNVNHKSKKDGRTVLHLAAKADLVDFVRYLCWKGADVNCQDLIGKTPLHISRGQSTQYLEQDNVRKMFLILATPCKITRLQAETKLYLSTDMFRYLQTFL